MPPSDPFRETILSALSSARAQVARWDGPTYLLVQTERDLAACERHVRAGEWFGAVMAIAGLGFDELERLLRAAELAGYGPCEVCGVDHCSEVAS